MGRITRAHGVRGGWAVLPITTAPDAIFASGAVLLAGDREGHLALRDGAPVSLTIVDGRPMTKEWLLRTAEITDRDVAATWKGRYLLVDAARLPAPDDDELYVFSLIGMQVDVEGQGPVGTVRDVYDAPQGLLLEVETDSGRHLVPWHEDLIASLDEDARRIVIKPLDGLLG